jgi:hypothetical protein
LTFSPPTGNIVYEQVQEVRGSDGLFMEVTGSAQRVGKPSFAASAEAGTVKISPRVFNASQSRWVDAADVANGDYQQLPCGKLRVLTFNTWFADIHFDERCAAHVVGRLSFFLAA